MKHIHSSKKIWSLDQINLLKIFSFTVARIETTFSTENSLLFIGVMTISFFHAFYLHPEKLVSILIENAHRKVFFISLFKIT